MKTLISLFVLLTFVVAPSFSDTQTHKITGTVVSFNKYPLKNIKIKAKKAKTETYTNEMGEFEIEVKDKDILQIKESVFTEYHHKITEVDQSLKINLIFENTGNNVDLATRSGYISREDLEYGLEHLHHENNVYSNFLSVYDAIKYALPETTIIVEDGRRGIQFRGPKTIHGSNMALLVVDDVIVSDVTFLNPSQIVSISKVSMSNASIYGARAANGVIKITTK
jgi:hypothetical protein